MGGGRQEERGKAPSPRALPKDEPAWAFGPMHPGSGPGARATLTSKLARSLVLVKSTPQTAGVEIGPPASGKNLFAGKKQNTTPPDQIPPPPPGRHPAPLMGQNDEILSGSTPTRKPPLGKTLKKFFHGPLGRIWPPTHDARKRHSPPPPRFSAPPHPTGWGESSPWGFAHLQKTALRDDVPVKGGLCPHQLPAPNKVFGGSSTNCRRKGPHAT